MVKLVKEDLKGTMVKTATMGREDPREILLLLVAESNGGPSKNTRNEIQ